MSQIDGNNSVDLFTPFENHGMTLHNRIVMAPMCMYSCWKEDGVPHDFHLVHLGARAVGKVGLIIAEATAVEPAGRISMRDCGLWNDEQARAYARIASFVKNEEGVKFGIQLAHAGRKHEGTDPLVAPSPIAFSEKYRTPKELDLAGIDRIVDLWGQAAKHAREIVDCDMVEIHSAHGYLLHEFLSPISNKRTDEYGGTLENRCRLLKRIYETVRENFGHDRPVWVRISCTDWSEESEWNLDAAVELSRLMKSWGVDLVDCSSGGNTRTQEIKIFTGYQVPFAERIRREAQIPTGAVGLITDAQQANDILKNGQADVVLLGRELLRDPQWALHAAQELNRMDIDWPRQYVYHGNVFGHRKQPSSVVTPSDAANTGK